MVYGIRPVLEVLDGTPSQIEVLLFASRESPKLREIREKARHCGVPVRFVSRDEIARLCGTPHHQDVLALLPPFPYASLEEILACRPDLVAAADGVEDPRNLGALVRSLAAAGAGGLVLPKDRACGVTPAAEKTSAGAVSRIPVSRVTNLCRALRRLREAGYWIVGLDVSAERSLYEVDLPSPLVLVVGGETGIRPLVARHCDLLARIPLACGVESLNLSVAAALAAFEFRRRQGLPARGES
ncbi:MAG: 23S rRNA (guanosine(2251)-2'-O)-methyltransferase RlmB [Candidatus Binatia bacterium]|nr:MAG: 23S rRNA (guanosine(2251)-2'-O)-methyltransferase RlmB [Candidatus Binatia bacterium]